MKRKPKLSRRYIIYHQWTIKNLKNVSLKTIRKTKRTSIHRNISEYYLNKRRSVRIRMAPYTPPISHYSQMDVSQYTEEQIFAFIGKNGKRFYWLTQKLGLEYLWYDKDRKVFEIWGPYYTHVDKQSALLIECEMDYFLKPKLECASLDNQDEYVQTTVAAC